ncbi:MAG: hypothetical protein U5K29_06825 [Acidimicrobiales bacterium]|nr:hypothetical protein [Acidimicrobiales bacterium]
MTDIASPAGRSSAGLREVELARWLAGPALIAALVELALLRLATRTAIHIPGIQELAGPYQVVSSVGRFAFYAGAVLVAVTLALLVPLLTRHDKRAEACALGAVVLAAVATRFDVITGTALAVVVGGAVAVLAFGLALADPRLRAFVGLFGAAFLAAVAHAIAQDLSGAGSLRPRSTSELLAASELLLLVGVVALALVVRTDGRDRLVGAGIGLIVFGALTASAATTKILILWTFGLPGYLPPLFYAAAAGLMAAVLTSAVRRDRALAIGLGLLAAGGVGLHSSYQSMLVVCGLALLVLLPPRPVGAVIGTNDLRSIDPEVSP